MTLRREEIQGHLGDVRARLHCSSSPRFSVQLCAHSAALPSGPDTPNWPQATGVAPLLPLHWRPGVPEQPTSKLRVAPLAQRRRDAHHQPAAHWTRQPCLGSGTRGHPRVLVPAIHARIQLAARSVVIQNTGSSLHSGVRIDTARWFQLCIALPSETFNLVSACSCDMHG